MQPDDEPMAPSITASLLAGVLEAATDAIITVDPRQRIVLFNRAAETMFGWPRGEVMHQPLDRLIPQRFRAGHLDGFRQFAATGLTVCGMGRPAIAIQGLRANGEEFPIEVSISQVATPEGQMLTAIVRDITGRQRAERALLDSEQRHAALFASAPVPMWVFEQAGGRFLKVNQAAVDDYGYSQAEFLSMTLADIQSGAGPVFAPGNRAGGGRQRQGPYPHRRKDGSVFFVDVLARPIRHDGRPACFAVALDATAQVRAEVAVCEQMFTLQRAADAAQAISAHQSLEGMTRELAEQARGVIGAHQAAVSLAVDGDWSRALQALALSADYAGCRDRLPLHHGSAIYRRAGNRSYPLRLSQAQVQAHADWRQVGSAGERDRMMRGWLAVPLMARDGRHIGVLQLSARYEGDFTLQDEYIATEMAQMACIAVENACLVQEVSRLNAGLEKKVAERTAALERQEALFRALAEQAPQIIWTTDQNGDVTYLNHAWFALMGGRLEDWMGRQWIAALHPEDLPGLRQNWALAGSSQQPFSGIRRWLCRDGSIHTMAYRASPVRDEEGRVLFWVGIDADVTEFKLIEAALRRSNEELEAFSYSVSHDLRAPLSTIDGFGALLARQLAGGDNEKARHCVARIRHGVAQMGRLIEDLLSLARVTRTRLRCAQIDLSAMALGILDEWRLRQPGRQVRAQVAPGLTVQADEALLRAVMENLLGNAWKFSALQAQARISVGQQLDAAGQPVFFVQDNGAGFDMAHAERLFLPFERLHAAAEFAGSGIGLATASRIIGHHGGRLWADAKPGQGATFYFTLPRQALTG